MTLIQFRRGTAALWASADAELAEGEFGFESDTRKFKIGPGKWNALDYMDAPTVLDEIATDVIDTNLGARNISFTDIGNGEGYFTIGTIQVNGTLVPPAATWSGVAGKPGAHAQNLGIATDGETETSTELETFITGLPDGETLYLHEGTYYAPNLRHVTIDKNLTIRGVPGKTRIAGDGTITIGDPEADVVLYLTTGGSLTIKDVIFEDVGIVAGFRDLYNVGDIKLIDCQFINSPPVSHLYDPDDLETRLIAGYTAAFNDFLMSGCLVKDCERGAFLRCEGGWNSVMMHDNVFDNVGYVGTEVGYEYGALADRTAFQPGQGRVNIHDNIFRNIRRTQYITFANSAKAITINSQQVIIHDNHIEGVDDGGAWDNIVGIYTKARYTDIHDNVLMNAGGKEATIVCKGPGWEKSTTIAAGSSGATLPQSTIHVESTEGFGPPFGTHGEPVYVLIETSEGWQSVGFTSKTATTLTGCTGGTGVLATGKTVRGEANGFDALSGVSTPGKVHNNVIAYTRTDVAQRGIQISVPDMIVSDNLIVGATGIGINTWVGCVVERNILYRHHGSLGISVGASRAGRGTIIRDNAFIDFDGSYAPGAPLYCMYINPGPGVDFRDILIEGNQIRNELNAIQGLGGASLNMYGVVVLASATGSISDIVIKDNRGRNLAFGLVVSAAGPVSNLSDIDNDWYNEAGSQPFSTTTHASPVKTRAMPTSTVVQAALDFPQVAAQGFQDLTVSVPGAAPGQRVALGSLGPWGPIVYQAWVSATDTVTVRAANYTSAATDPISATFWVQVLA